MALKPLIAGSLYDKTPAGSGSGDVTASGTLTNNSIILGGGTKVVKATTTGTGIVTALGVNVGSAGAPVVQNGALGTPSSGTLTNASGLPISTGVAGLGTGIATALAVNVGTAGAPVVQNGALGTPSSGTLTNCTGLPASGVTGTALTQASTAHAIQIAQIVTLTSAGTDTFTGTAGVTATAYNNGDTYVFIANNANSGAASLNIDGLGAITIVKVAGGVTTTLADNDIRSGQVCIVSYDGTNFQLQSTLGNAGGGGLGGSTGSVDNAMLRADGTGGATVQSSDITVSDASTSTQNQVAIANVHAGQSNSTLVLSPKGTGAIQAGPVADGTSTGGNARGAGAVDLQLTHGNAARVASGANSFAAGTNCTASGQDAIGMGNFSSAAGTGSVGIGTAANASADYAFASGNQSTADRRGMRAHSSGRFGAGGDSQAVSFVLRCKTTTNAAVEMGLDNNGGSLRLTVASGTMLHGLLIVEGTKSDGSAAAVYMRQVAIANVGGTTSLVGSVITIGTDTAASTSLAVTADDASDFLSVAPTGITSETWRWTATFIGVQQTYGT